eukprot:scaffold219863_cov32-Tisochrysis_lutea.AAC.5
MDSLREIVSRSWLKGMPRRGDSGKGGNGVRKCDQTRLFKFLRAQRACCIGRVRRTAREEKARTWTIRTPALVRRASASTLAATSASTGGLGPPERESRSFGAFDAARRCVRWNATRDRNKASVSAFALARMRRTSATTCGTGCAVRHA